MLSIGKRFDHHLLFLFTNKAVTSLQAANIDRPIAVSKYSLGKCIRKLICPIKKPLRGIYTSAIETVQGYIWGIIKPHWWDLSTDINAVGVSNVKEELV